MDGNNTSFRWQPGFELWGSYITARPSGLTMLGREKRGSGWGGGEEGPGLAWRGGVPPLTEEAGGQSRLAGVPMPSLSCLPHSSLTL